MEYKLNLWLFLNIICISLIGYAFLPNLIYSSWKYWIVYACIMVIFSSIISFMASLIFYREDVKSTFELLKRMINKGVNANKINNM